VGISVEGLFTSALGLQQPWEVHRVELDTERSRIDFFVNCTSRRLSCPACAALDQPRHDSKARQWRHLDFFQYEAWLHADVPRVACAQCGKTTQVPVPWANPGSGFTLLFEALAISLCAQLPVAQVARLLRCADQGLWSRIQTEVDQARAKESFEGVSHIGIDETSVKKGHHYITVVHDLDSKRLMFATPGRSAQAVQEFVSDLSEHQGRVQDIEHVCMDMSAAYTAGVQQELPQAQISYDRFHVAQLLGRAMDEVRKTELKDSPNTYRAAFADESKKGMAKAMWAMRTNEANWSEKQAQVMQQLKDSNLKSAEAWRLKTALKDIYDWARKHSDKQTAQTDLQAWCSLAKQSGLAPFKRVVKTLKRHWSGVVMGMLDNRSNAFVEAMNGMLQQAKRAARGFRKTDNLIAIAYLRMSKLKHLPKNPLRSALARGV
jgi:transposase